MDRVARSVRPHGQGTGRKRCSPVGARSGLRPRPAGAEHVPAGAGRREHAPEIRATSPGERRGVMRSRSGRGGAESEYGLAVQYRPFVRNRHRKKCPASAPIRCRRRPRIRTDTTRGASGTTDSTRMRCTRFSRTGVKNRYQSSSAPTVPYSTYQAARAAALPRNSAPVESWCQNARYTAAYVRRCR